MSLWHFSSSMVKGVESAMGFMCNCLDSVLFVSLDSFLESNAFSCNVSIYYKVWAIFL